jgi:hypothetical protein
MEDPGQNEVVLVANQMLGCISFLWAYTALSDDVNALARKQHKPGG